VPWASVGPPVRIPAADIVHLFEPRFAGQLRGISPLAPIATRLLEIDALEDAVLAKARVNALFTGFVRDMDGSSGLAGDGKIDPATLSMEPGTLRVLPAGTDVTFTPQADIGAIGEVLKHMIRSACAGVAIPYMLAASDLAETNFSSAQVGIAAFKRRIKAFQQNHIVAQVLAPVWKRFVMLEVLTGRIRAPDFERNPESYLTAKFLFPGWPALDPLKQSKATVLDLNAGIRSRAEVIAENGRDVADVDAEIEADNIQGDLTAVSAAALAQPEPQDAP
jgi:lambda family phage portal protein